MASHPPPFQVEDNTDEAFFDDLVNDDFQVGNHNTTTPTHGANAMSSLSIHDDGHKGEGNWEHHGHNADHHGQKGDVHGDHHLSSGSNHERVDDLSANKGTAEHIVESRIADVMSDSLLVSEHSGGTVIPEIKEVGWSAFQTGAGNVDSNRFGSYSDFFSEFDGEKEGVALGDVAQNSVDHADSAQNMDMSNTWEHSGNYSNGHGADQISINNDLNNIRYWENQYPGWKYDPSTGQWYQVDGFDAGTSMQAVANSNGSSVGLVADGQSISDSGTDWNRASQLSNAVESTTDWSQVSQACSPDNGGSSNWDQASHVNNGYQPHMVFDPQYPGWYYDTIAMEWCSLESYHASAQPTNQDLGQIHQGTLESYGASAQLNPQVQGQINQGVSESYGVSAQSNADVQGNINHGTLESYNLSSQSTAPVHGQMNQIGYDLNQVGTVSSYYQPQYSQMQPSQTVGSNHATELYSGNIHGSNPYGHSVSMGTPGSQQKSVSMSTPISDSGSGIQRSSDHYGTKGLYHENQSQDQNKFSMPSMSDDGENLMPHFNDSQINHNDKKNFSSDYYSNQRSFSFSKKQVQNAQISYAPAARRSSAGRPAHALIAFGFGGKLIVMKQDNFENLNFGNQNHSGGSISVLNLVEVVNCNIDTSNHGMGGSIYFQALCRQSIPGPLTGGSVGTKELNKWIDERITNLESTYMDYGKEVLKLLLLLLKIACQYYGKLRSPHGSNAEFKESDTPESAIAKLFASAKINSLQTSQYGSVARCLHQIPSEGELQVTAVEVQNLLVSGRKIEALQCAREGQFWGPALVLAAQLGNQFYVETVKKMALCHLAAGSPLRTLCLLIASQPADVFSGDNAAIGNMPCAPNFHQQPEQVGANGMLDDWEENLAVITANRTKDDELVLIHLGDCLWKDRNDIIAAHICYLISEASFEPYSDSARLCLVGADHLKSPRTYASPEAIQRTEIYEYSKTLGNSQFVLMSFQPYKYVYALMLAEVGRMSEALKYCQALVKSLKNGRTPEVETLRHLVSSLEERIKTHQQGGFYTNLAPKEFIGKLLKVFDSTAHRVVGGLPPTIPTAGSSLHGNKDHHQSGYRGVSASQSTMAMSSLMPSQSMEPISGLAGDAKGNRMAVHTRSVSEPDFGRNPVQVRAESLKEPSSAGEQHKPSASGTSSFSGFGFGSQLFQKTIGFVLKNRRQAKLGDENKFYYDEKLKRWVEEGAEAPAAEVPLPPPPTSFQNGASDYNLKNAMKNEAALSYGSTESKSSLDSVSGMPPLPPTTNQYSARGRMGVRSRYVDTFNRGGGNATSAVQSPIVPSVKPPSGANQKFFVPMAVSSVEKPDTTVNTSSNNTLSPTHHSPLSPPNEPASPSPIIMQRFPSMNTILSEGKLDDSFSSPHSRRTASWSGGINESTFSPPLHGVERKPLGEILGLQPTTPTHPFSSTNGGSIGDDLHEVKL